MIILQWGPTQSWGFTAALPIWNMLDLSITYNSVPQLQGAICLFSFNDSILKNIVKDKLKWLTLFHENKWVRWAEWCDGECKWNVVASKEDREKDLRRMHTTLCGNLHLLFTLQSESCLVCPCLGPYSLNGDGDTEPKETSLFLCLLPCIYTSPPLFLQKMGPLPTSHWQLGTIHHSIRVPVLGIRSHPIHCTAKVWVGQTSITITSIHWHQGHTNENKCKGMQMLGNI